MVCFMKLNSNFLFYARYIRETLFNLYLKYIILRCVSQSFFLYFIVNIYNFSD